MKKFIGLVVILAILVLGSYYVTGMMTEKRVKENIALINQANGVYIDVKDYQRGWFTSSANLDWNFQYPNKQLGKMESVKFKMPLEVFHGPVMFPGDGVKLGLGYAHTVVQMPDKNMKQMKDLFTSESTEPKLNLSLLINFLGKASFNASVPDFTLVAKKGGAKFNWHGLDSSISIAGNQKAFNGYFNIDGFNFTRQNMSAKLDTVKTKYNLYENGDGLLLGHASMSFPSLIVKMGKQTIFELSKFDIESGSKQSGDVVNSDVTMSLGKVIAQNETYGPGEIHFSLNNLDSKALARINQLAKEAQMASEQEQKQLMMAMMPELPKLLKHGAQIKIEPFHLKLPEGKVEGNLQVSLPKNSGGNPFQMARKVKGKGRLSVPMDMVKQMMVETLAKQMMSSRIQQAMAQQSNNQTIRPMDAKQQATEMVNKKLAAMVEKGLLAKEGSDYVIAFTLENGNLKINGAPFNPAMMQF